MNAWNYWISRDFIIRSFSCDDYGGKMSGISERI